MKQELNDRLEYPGPPGFPPTSLSLPVSLSLSLSSYLFSSIFASIWLCSVDRLHTAEKITKNSLEFAASELSREGDSFSEKAQRSAATGAVIWPLGVTYLLFTPTALLRGWNLGAGGPKTGS